MLIARGHSEVFVAQELSYRVDVCALHPEPACRRVSEVVESKIRNLYCVADSSESNTHLFGRDISKEFVRGPCLGVER